MRSKMRSEDNFMGFPPTFSWALEIRLWSSVPDMHYVLNYLFKDLMLNSKVFVKAAFPSETSGGKFSFVSVCIYLIGLTKLYLFKTIFLF